jgi:hypothetical protein
MHQTQEATRIEARETGLSLKDIYTPLSEAREEVWRRWNDKGLQREVERFLEKDIPDFFRSEPRAVLAHHVATPNREATRFLNIARESGLDFVFAEYGEDKFTPQQNPDKYYLGRLMLYNEKGRKGGERVSGVNIVDFNANNGKRLNQVETLWGEGFVSFHHRIFQEVFSSSYLGNVHDISGWLKRHGGAAQFYYLHYLALFVCKGILVESFFADKREIDFIDEVVLPVVSKLKETFGVKPLIVPLFSVHSAKDSDDYVGTRWMHYPEFIRYRLNGSELVADGGGSHVPDRARGVRNGLVAVPTVAA